MFRIINKFRSHLLPVQIIRSSMKLWKSQIRWGGVGCMKFMKVRNCVRLKCLIILERKYSFKNLHARKSLVFCKQGTRRSYGYTRSHVKIRLFSIPNFALDIDPSKMKISPRSKRAELHQIIVASRFEFCYNHYFSFILVGFRVIFQTIHLYEANKFQDKK